MLVRQILCNFFQNHLGAHQVLKMVNIIDEFLEVRAEHHFEVTHGHTDVQFFVGEWDEEGVYVYQAFKDEIADWALEHQYLGGPHFNTTRMTWIKPSFAWVLYRSGYGKKGNQNRVLKIKLPHDAIAHILSLCQCKESGGGSKGRVQWDPARDIMTSDDKGKTPRKRLRERAIQIGMKGSISQFYVQNIIQIEDVTELAQRVGKAHKIKNRKKSEKAMKNLLPDLPLEHPYMPCCSNRDLRKLGLLPGETATFVAGLGVGKAFATN